MVGGECDSTAEEGWLSNDYPEIATVINRTESMEQTCSSGATMFDTYSKDDKKCSISIWE